MGWSLHDRVKITIERRPRALELPHARLDKSKGLRGREQDGQRDSRPAKQGCGVGAGAAAR